MVDELGEGEGIENILVGEGEEVKDETAGEGELNKELKDEGSKYTDFIGKCMKTGKTMKQCAVLWKKEKPETEEKEDIWSGFNEKEMEAELENLMKAQMAVPKMSAIVYAMKQAGVSEAMIKEAMVILRKKYPYPYPGAGDDIGNLPEIKKKVGDTKKDDKESLEAKNKELTEKVEQMNKLERKSVKGEVKKDELAEDEVYVHILKGIGGV